MTKASIIALTAFVWTTAFAATGTLVHVVNRPLPVPPQVSTLNVTAAIARAPQKAQPPPQQPQVEERVITLPTVEIVGSYPAPKPVQQIKHEDPKPRELHCHEWRPLDQGSNSVQICD